MVVITGNTPLTAETALPDNVRVERFIPYGHLLPHVDVMVTNGGFNGVTAALVNGVPLVVAPGSEEKDDVAARVGWADAGVVVKRNSLTPHRIRAAVREVLGNSTYRGRAGRLRQEHQRHDGPQRAADLIDGLLGVAPTSGGKP